MVDILLAPECGDVQLPVTLGTWHQLDLTLSLALNQVAFAQFEAHDAHALYDIRNHPSVLPFMPSPDPLPMEQHMAWVKEHLLDGHAASPLLLIGRDNHTPVGFGVIKPLAHRGAYELGVMVTGAWQRSLLPPRLAATMAAIAEKLLGAEDIVTYVNEKHGQALDFNRRWQLREEGSDRPGQRCFRSPAAYTASTSIFRRCTRDLRISVSRRQGA